MKSDRSGWLALAEWTFAAAAVALGVLSILSIGVFVLPVAAIVMALVAIRNRIWPEGVAGMLMGAGLTSLCIAYIQRDSSACPPGGFQTVALDTLTVGRNYSCGGFDPLPWLLAGCVLIGAGLYTTLRGRSRLWPAPDQVGAS